MKDLTELRKDFEKLPEIAKILLHDCSEVFFCEDINEYKNNRVFWDSEIGFINGAWYAYQEQEKLVSFLYAAINDALDGFEDGEFNYCYKALRKALGDRT